MPRRVPDTTKIRSLIGFQPSMNLDEIILSVVESMGGPVGAAASAPAKAETPRRRAQLVTG